MKYVILSIALAAILVFAATLQQTQAKAFYTKPSKWMVFFTVNPIDPNTGKSNNCYSEWYHRTTPKNANHDLLNKEERENPNPNNGPSKVYAIKWFFDIDIFHESDDVNEGKIRNYGFTVKVGSDEQNPTITKYLPIETAKKVKYNGKTVMAIDFKKFNLPTDPSNCKGLVESTLAKRS